MFDSGHIPSLLIILAMIFGITFAIFSAMKPGSGQELEVGKSVSLTITERYRIGVDSSLYADKTKISRISEKFGDYLTIVETSDNLTKWYKDNAMSRPPILGAISQSGTNWTIVVPTHLQSYLPTLESIVAMRNNEDLKKPRFKENELKRELDLNVSESESWQQVQKDVKVMEIFMRDNGIFPFLLTIVTPLMVIRPVSFLIIERVSNFAHQERLTGVNRVVIIASSIFYDFLLFLPHWILFFCACFASAHKVATERVMELIYLPFIAFLSGELVILIFYRLFATRAKGFALILIFIMVNNLASLIVTIVMKMMDLMFITNKTEKSIHLVVSPMLTALVWSQSSSHSMMMKDAMKNAMRDLKGIEPPPRIAYITGPVFILLHFLIYAAILVLAELRVRRLCRKRNEEIAPAAASGEEDSLVLRVNNLHKWYGGGKNRKNAVNGINFGVRAHECFGVLGINGAGKTSTFEMLTGNTLPSRGSATVGGVDCSKAPTIGYCPQADALVEDLTGRQSLIILAALHGYENPRNVADIVITCVGMQDHAHRRTGTYSGGQRRKISVAASLLAQNSLIILDEPTAGIDPIARRDIWSVICALRESTNTAIVLTSHSMDEVEALVSNLIIMRAGLIVVEGSPQMIKNQFGGHYKFNLIIENVTKVEEVTAQVLSSFPTASLYDSASLRNIKYRIPRLPSDIFSALFEKASSIADHLNATDFCFTQATLEDAFMLAATATVPQGVAPQEMNAVTGTASNTVSAPEKATVPVPEAAAASSPDGASTPEEKTADAGQTA